MDCLFNSFPAPLDRLILFFIFTSYFWIFSFDCKFLYFLFYLICHFNSNVLFLHFVFSVDWFSTLFNYEGHSLQMSTCFICFLFSSFLVSSYFFLPRLLLFLPVSPLNFLSSLLFYSAHLSHCFHSLPSRFQELKDIDEDTTEAQAISRLKKAQTCISNGYVYARQWNLTISSFSFCWVHSHFCAFFIFICVYFPCSHGMFSW